MFEIYTNETRRPAAKPKSIGRGNPGNIPFLSTILKASRHPNEMPMMDAKHDMKPKLISICPESIE